MLNTDIVAQQQKNLNAGNAFVAWAMLFHLLGHQNSMYFVVVGSIWSVYFWRKQFKLRREQFCYKVRSAREILAEATRRRSDSLVLLMPLFCGCLLVLGFMSNGIDGLRTSLRPAAVYVLLLLIAERYPIENKYA